MWLGRDQTCQGGREALEVPPPQSLAGELLGTEPQFPHLSNRDDPSPPTSRILLGELRPGGGVCCECRVCGALPLWLMDRTWAPWG